MATYCDAGGSGGFEIGDSRKGIIVSIPRTLGRTGLAMVIASGEVIVSNRSSVSPTAMTSPGFSSHCLTDSPFTFVPHLLPASSIVAQPPSSKTRQWRRETDGSSNCIEQSIDRPMLVGCESTSEYVVPELTPRVTRS